MSVSSYPWTYHCYFDDRYWRHCGINVDHNHQIEKQHWKSPKFHTSTRKTHTHTHVHTPVSQWCSSQFPVGRSDLSPEWASAAAARSWQETRRRDQSQGNGLKSKKGQIAKCSWRTCSMDLLFLAAHRCSLSCSSSTSVSRSMIFS